VIETRTDTHAIISRRPQGFRRFTSGADPGRYVVLKSTKMESRRCVRQSHDANEAILSRPEVLDILARADNLTTLKGGQKMASKDKNTKKTMGKKPAQKTLKEKRQAKKAKK